MTDTSTAIVCSLTEPDLRNRKVVLRSELKPYLTQATYVAGTSRLVFTKPEVTRQILEHLIVLESDCCPFFSFDLSETDTHFHLSVAGPKGIEDMVRNFFSTSGRVGCGCTGTNQSSGTRTTRNVAGFITLCAIACAIPPTLAALGLIGVATGAFIGKGIEVAVIALALMGLGYVLLQYVKKKRGASS